MRGSQLRDGDFLVQSQTVFLVDVSSAGTSVIDIGWAGSSSALEGGLGPASAPSWRSFENLRLLHFGPAEPVLLTITGDDLTSGQIEVAWDAFLL
jgi:hypothetical protein